MEKKIVIDTNLLFTNKGGNLRSVDGNAKTSVTVESLILKAVEGEVKYLGSTQLDADVPWWYCTARDNFGENLILSDNVSKHGDGPISEQLKYARKARITIELFD